jgi:hypothetical protein
MSVPSEDHKSDVKSDRHGDQLIAKRQALELVPHDVSLPFVPDRRARRLERLRA